MRTYGFSIKCNYIFSIFLPQKTILVCLSRCKINLSLFYLRGSIFFKHTKISFSAAFDVSYFIYKLWFWFRKFLATKLKEIKFQFNFLPKKRNKCFLFMFNCIWTKPLDQIYENCWSIKKKKKHVKEKKLKEKA